MRSLNRRRFVTAGVVAAALGVNMSAARAKDDEGPEKEVEAVEDLMREHGVLRRALVVYTIAGARVRAGRAIPVDALGQAAQLFRRFGEQYHERLLEEKHVFPAVARSGGSLAHLTDVLAAQHARGREITAYLLEVTRSGRLAPANAAPLAQVLDAFVLMYRRHAAIEDTVVFPAWKASITTDDYHELSERFEDLEHEMFGTAPQPPAPAA